MPVHAVCVKRYGSFVSRAHRAVEAVCASGEEEKEVCEQSANPQRCVAVLVGSRRGRQKQEKPFNQVFDTFKFDIPPPRAPGQSHHCPLSTCSHPRWLFTEIRCCSSKRRAVGSEVSFSVLSGAHPSSGLIWRQHTGGLGGGCGT